MYMYSGTMAYSLVPRPLPRFCHMQCDFTLYVDRYMYMYYRDHWLCLHSLPCTYAAELYGYHSCSSGYKDAVTVTFIW